MKKSSIILGCLLSLLLANPCHADFREHYELGQQYLYNSQYSSSIDEFKKALRINYLDTSARIGLVNAYLARGTYYANKAGNYSDAADDFRSALFYVKYYPKGSDVQNGYATSVSATNSLNYCLKQLGFDYSAESRYNKADQLRTEGKFPAAIYELEQVTSNPKFKKTAMAQIADMIKILGNNERAADYYKEALKLDPHNGPLLLRYARLLDKLGRQDEAVAQYNTALSESDNDPEILYALERIYLKKLDSYPKDPELNANIGAIKQKQGDYVNALVYYKKAEEYSATTSDINSRINTRLNIGTLFQAQKNYEKALEVYKSILVEYPDNLNANLYTAQCLEAMGENAKAIDAYEKVLSLDPTNSEIRQSIVTIKRNSMTPEELLSYIESNSQVDKTMVDTMYDYAIEYHKKNDVDNAIKFYRGVLKFNKSKADVYTNLALCYAEKKDYTSAKEILTTAKQRFPNNKTIAETLSDLNSASVLDAASDAYEAYSSKDYNKAIQLYSAMTPQTKDTLLGIAASYEGLQDSNNAIAYYKKALNIEPNNSDIAYSIGALYANKEDWYNAKTYLQKAVSLNPNNKDASAALTDIKKVTSQIQVQKGADLFNSSKFDDALKSFNQAILDDATNSDAYYYRAMIYDGKNQRNLAINDYKKAVQYNPEQYIANYLIAVDLDTLGQYKNALTYYKKFVSQYKTDDEYLKYTKARIQELAKYGN